MPRTAHGLFLIAAMILLSACGKKPAAAPAGCAPGTYDEQIDSGGQTRQYRLHVPPGYRPGTPVPLIIGFHGAGSTGAEFESYSGFSALADQAGFIAVYPQGLGDLSNWDTLPNSRDLAFIRDLLDRLEARCSLDPAKVYATGHSRGGGMANRLGCNLASRIAAIAPVSGDYENGADCAPARPVAVIAFHGTADPVLPYNGFGLPGQIHESYQRIGTPIPSWAADWAARDGCDSQTAISADQPPVSTRTWSGCRAGAEVILYTIDGGTHDWPTALDAARTIWDFFLQHPLTSP